MLVLNNVTDNNYLLYVYSEFYCSLPSDHLEQSKVIIYNNFTNMSQPGHKLYTHTDETSTFRKEFDPPIIVRYLGITNVNEHVAITICELKLIESGK